MEIDWSPTKNAELKMRYGFGFERVLAALDEGAVLDRRTHPNLERYGHQHQLILRIDDYAWIVPFVVDGQKLFFKTMFPSRKATRKYMER